MKQQYMRELSNQYKESLAPFLRYLPWFEEHAGKSTGSSYNGSMDGNNTMSFPVYDSTLLSFVKEMGKSSFMDRNYVYIYSRRRLKTLEDERKAIKAATIQEWDVLCGILSKYVIGGNTRSQLWTQAVKENIFLMVLQKMQSIIEYWDRRLED
ncbi:MAG: hypothetical protein K2K19_08640 [Acetatifactor sp.]|nr:hypothetical protein [Acetatifactor sp.]